MRARQQQDGQNDRRRRTQGRRRLRKCGSCRFWRGGATTLYTSTWFIRLLKITNGAAVGVVLVAVSPLRVVKHSAGDTRQSVTEEPQRRLDWESHISQRQRVHPFTPRLLDSR